MAGKILYLGDGEIPGAASYLAGIMTHYGLPFRHVPSAVDVPLDLLNDPEVGLFVLSDYPSARFSEDAMSALVARVKGGAGLLMFGGWESYHGFEGDYDTTPLDELLPVVMEASDDRRNCPYPTLIRKIADHEILGSLPFGKPAGIGGYNEFTPRPEALVLLEGERYSVTCSADAGADFQVAGRFPLLVVAEAEGGRGRSACLATDVAPHWVGGFVDWGDARLTVMMDNDFIEVGAWYAEFFKNLLCWCMDS